jgi:hypothetical protein
MGVMLMLPNPLLNLVWFILTNIPSIKKRISNKFLLLSSIGSFCFFNPEMRIYSQSYRSLPFNRQYCQIICWVLSRHVSTFYGIGLNLICDAQLSNNQTHFFI